MVNTKPMLSSGMTTAVINKLEAVKVRLALPYAKYPIIPPIQGVALIKASAFSSLNALLFMCVPWMDTH